VRDLVATLPAPQARRVACGARLDSGPTVEPFLVAVATLSILAEAAESGPVLGIVDGRPLARQPPRGDALLFAVRRLTGERVGVSRGSRP
jgi:hypothetical protein